MGAKWKWVIVCCGFFLGFLTDGIRFSFGLTYKEWLEEFNKGKGVTAGIGSLMFSMLDVKSMSGLNYIAVPAVAVDVKFLLYFDTILVISNAIGYSNHFLINKNGYRVTTIPGAIIYAGGLILSSLTPNFYFLYVSFGVICGIGFSFLYIPISISILQYFPEEKKSLANGIAMCGSGLGGFVFNPLLNTLFDEYAWRGALLVCSGIVLHGAVAGCLMRPVKENKDNLCDTTDQLKTGDSIKETIVNSDKNQSTVAHTQHDIFAIESTLNAWPVGIYKKKDFLNNFKNPQEATDKKCYSEVIAADNGSNYENSFDDTLSVPTLNEKDSSMRRNGDLKHFQRFGDNSVLAFERATSNIDSTDAYLANTNNETCKTEAKQKKGLFAWYILKDPRFLLFMVSQFFFAVAYMIPFTYLPEVVISLGYSREKAVWLMSAISIVSAVSRVASGWLADRNFINRRVLYCVANFICALSVLSLFFWRHYTPIMIASLVFAVTAGCIIATIAVVVSDLFGSELLSEAYGLSIFGRAPGNLSGPPFSGWIVDQTGRLELVFIVSGVAFAVGGVFIVLSVKCKDRLRFGEIS